jgi:hypothetical protein
MIFSNRHHTLACSLLSSRHKLPTLSIQTLGSHYLKGEALLLESLHELNGSLRFCLVLIRFFSALVWLKHLKSSGKRDLINDSIGMDRDQPILNLARFPMD